MLKKLKFFNINFFSYFFHEKKIIFILLKIFFNIYFNLINYYLFLYPLFAK